MTLHSQPTLIKDVSSFLSGLKSSGGSADAVPSTAKKGKATERKGKLDTQKASDLPQGKAGPKAPYLTKQKQKGSIASTSKTEEGKSVPTIPVPNSAASAKRGKFVVDPNPQWYTSLSALPPTGSLAQPTVQQLSSLNYQAAKLLQADAELYASTSLSSGDASFMQTILKSGTLSDRLSALTLMVQGSPVHNVKALEGLKSMMERGKGKGREEGLKAVRCVVDWWVGGGGPGRKLRCVKSVRLCVNVSLTSGSSQILP